MSLALSYAIDNLFRRGSHLLVLATATFQYQGWDELMTEHALGDFIMPTPLR